MQVTAVIPNWNGAERLEAILRDLQSQTEPVTEVIVVDNGSHDGSALAAEQLGARVVRFESNRGFTAAVNRGMAESRTELAAILNNDVRLSPDWLSRLRDAIVRLDAPFVCGKLLKIANHGIIDGCFDEICRGGCAWRCGEGRPDGPVWSEARHVSFIPFTAALFRREFFLEMGGLDEALGSYLEDVDFGLRCASNGYTGRYVPEAVAFHHGSKTLGRWNPTTVRQIARNQILLLARHYPTSLLIRCGWPIAIAHILWGLVALKHGAGFAWLLGKADGLRMFAAHRRVTGGDIAAVLGSSELQIRDLQKRTGWDWYWRLYFMLT
jgi:GT2 family glycosyltransferase